MNRSALRVLVTVDQYPKLSQTYIVHELNVLSRDYQLSILAKTTPNPPSDEALPYRRTHPRFRRLQENWACMRFKPHILHGHWLSQLSTIVRLSRKFSLPFTLRMHSMCMLRLQGRSRDPKVRHLLSPLNDELCLGVLSFPFTRSILEEAGVRPEKIIDSFPVVNVDRFHNTSPNGDGIMNTGCVLPKKKLEDYLDLAPLVPERKFNLYPCEYVEGLERLNSSKGGRVRVHQPVPHREIPARYKKNQWMVYTACRKLGTVGWPVAVAEAQASGVGVVFPNLRPDLADYVGKAGYMYDSLEEAAKIIRQPFPEDKRNLGFDLAERSNFLKHKHLLTELWDRGLDRVDQRA
ncbi:MAG: hypothetical protein IH909_03815 [Proteobacteria bacterium]|nr:hypothetical protein [Pseudomonadota bacterium]